MPKCTPGCYEVKGIKSHPRYVHDCENCMYLGYQGFLDLYVCPGSKFPTYIARQSSEGSDYRSGETDFSHLWATGHPIAEAQRRAKEANIDLTKTGKENYEANK